MKVLHCVCLPSSAGSIPAELLSGLYVRSGPNLQCWPPSNKHHAFNGEAMLHMVAPSHSHQIRYTNSWVMQKHQDSGFVGECGPAFGFGDLNGGGLAFLRVLLLRLRMKLLGISRPPQVGVETIESMNYSSYYNVSYHHRSEHRLGLQLW